MRRRRRQLMNQPIVRFIRMSAIIHFGILLFFLVIWPFIAGREKAPSQIVMVEITRGSSLDIGSGIKQAKDLPKSTIQEQKTPPIKPGETKGMPEVKKPNKPEKKEKGSPLLTDEMRQALKNVEQKIKERSAVPEAAQTKDPNEGNIYGNTDQARIPPDDPEYLRYQALVRAAIMKEWIIPPHLAALPAETKPKTGIIVMIDDKGSIVSTRVAYSSGFSALDDSAVRAIERTSLLPIPPERLKAEALGDGFLIEFMPN